MKSTSGGILMWGSSMLKSWSSTQATIALSSAEAELYAMSKCSQQALSIVSIAKDMFIDLRPTIYSDSTAALGIAYRRGLGGKTRHVKVQYLWMQGAVANKELGVTKVDTAENPADMLTKFLGIAIHSKHAAYVGYEFPAEDCKVGKAMANLKECEGIMVRIRNFAKHLGIAKTNGKWLESCLENL